MQGMNERVRGAIVEAEPGLRGPERTHSNRAALRGKRQEEES